MLQCLVAPSASESREDYNGSAAARTKNLHPLLGRAQVASLRRLSVERQINSPPYAARLQAPENTQSCSIHLISLRNLARRQRSVEMAERRMQTFLKRRTAHVGLIRSLP